MIPELSRILEQPFGETKTFGATSLDRIATLTQQIEVRTHLQKLTYRDIPDDVPLEVIDFVYRTFAKRFDSHGEANEENFTTALYFDDYVSVLNEDEIIRYLKSLEYEVKE